MKISMDSCIICLSISDPFSRITTQSLEWNKEQIQRVVEKHLWWLYLQPQSEEVTKCICRSCWQEISSFHNFYLKIEKIHNQYQTLLAISKPQGKIAETIPDNKKVNKAIHFPTLNLCLILLFDNDSYCCKIIR